MPETTKPAKVLVRSTRTTPVTYKYPPYNADSGGGMFLPGVNMVDAKAWDGGVKRDHAELLERGDLQVVEAPKSEEGLLKLISDMFVERDLDSILDAGASGTVAAAVEKQRKRFTQLSPEELEASKKRKGGKGRA